MNDRKREAEREREREPGAGKRSVEVTQLVYFPMPTLDIYNKRVSDPGSNFKPIPHRYTTFSILPFDWR